MRKTARAVAIAARGAAPVDVPKVKVEAAIKKEVSKKTSFVREKSKK
jgi:hypothetical protein